MKPFTFIFLLLTTWGTGCVSRYNNASDDQGRFVQLDVEGKKYEHIFMKVVDTTPTAQYVTGKSADGYGWTFNIPDSIPQNIWGLHFFFTSGNDTLGIAFAAVLENDTLTSSVNNFENNSDTLLIKGVYMNNEPVYHSDILKVDFKEKTYMTECMQYPGVAFFYDPNNEKKYDDFMDDYTFKIKANPNSVYYISNLSAAVDYYNLNDLKKLVELFSPEIQNSNHGRKISQYIDIKQKFLDSKFENSILPVMNSEISESIIQDSSKYNLIIFSASWCAPCRAEIPLLKEIYNDLSQNLIVTYISTDELSTVDSWRKLMQQENIPWRSLLAMNDVKKIKKTYFVEGVPYIMLIYPKNLHFEILDIKTKEDKDKLYLLCDKNAG